MGKVEEHVEPARKDPREALTPALAQYSLGEGNLRKVLEGFLRYTQEVVARTAVVPLTSNDPREIPKVFLAHKEGMIEVTSPPRRIKTDRRFFSVESLVDYCQRYLSPPQGAIYYEPGRQLLAMVNELHPEDGAAWYPFARSREIARWTPGAPWKHSDFIDHLVMFGKEVAGFEHVDGGTFQPLEGVSLEEVLVRLYNLKGSEKTEYESEVAPNSGNIRVSFASKAGGGVHEIPRWWRVSVPVIAGDLRENPSVLLRLEFHKPDQGRPLGFSFSAPFLARDQDEAERLAVDLVRERLSDWLVVEGAAPVVQ